MELFTKRITEMLINNGLDTAARQRDDEPEVDRKPVVKIFDPSGAATWLITEQVAGEPDLLFGLCDLGLGFPELGYVSKCELQDTTGRFGLHFERDLHFNAIAPLSVYAKAARDKRQIVETPEALGIQR